MPRPSAGANSPSNAGGQTSTKAPSLAWIPVVLLIGAFIWGQEPTPEETPATTGKVTATPAAERSNPASNPATPAAFPRTGQYEQAFLSAEAFWASEFPRIYGTEWTPLLSENVAVGTGEAVTVCGDVLPFTSYETNAIATQCRDGSGVIVADGRFLNEIQPKAVGSGLVVAHEYGHIVQAQLGLFGKLDDIVAEQQADCFAGAWLRHVETANTFGTFNVDDVVPIVLLIGDAVGDGSGERGIHGLPFDRFRALSEGYYSGAGYCAGYPDRTLPLVESQFTDINDRITGGNAPLDEVLFGMAAATAEMLAVHAKTPVPEYIAVNRYADEFESSGYICNGALITLDWLNAEQGLLLCDRENIIYIDTFYFQDAYRYGDMAAGGILAMRLAQARGASPYEQHCYLGAIMSDLQMGEDDAITLSPGDLDELVLYYLALDSADSGSGNDIFAGLSVIAGGYERGFAKCRSMEG